MTTFEIILLVLACVVPLIPIWALYCNDKTYKQRRNLIPSVGDPLFREKFNTFDKVTYNQHCWRLMTFRDPYALYK